MPAPSPRTLTAVFVGGAVGTLGRALLLQASPVVPGSWPWATLVANLVATALLGAVIGRTRTRSGWWHPFLATGVCGGLSTFSTLQLELVQLVDVGAYALAFGYAAASVLLGLPAVVAGLRIGARNPS